MISLEDWALIRHLHRSEGLSQRAIARQLGIARETVARALASDCPPKYERPLTPSAINDVEPRIRALLSAYPQLPATVLAERVGWTGSISWFRERVRAIRPEYLPADPVDRLVFPRRLHHPGLGMGGQGSSGLLRVRDRRIDGCSQRSSEKIAATGLSRTSPPLRSSSNNWAA